jgi:hypothetical protein
MTILILILIFYSINLLIIKIFLKLRCYLQFVYI